MAAYSPMGSPEPTSENMLTPRSKVAKMLADIDAASSPSSSTAILHPKLSPEPRQSGQRMAGPFDLGSSDESEDSADDIRRPLGRAARRMLGPLTHQPGKTDSIYNAAPRRSLPPEFADVEDDLYSATPERSRNLIQDRPGTSLFVSPAKSSWNDQDDDDLPRQPLGSKERLAALVAQKRAERKAREQEREQDDARQDSPGLEHTVSDSLDEQAANRDVERLLSDAVRPARKASKKALQEMARETQRIAREQALAHEMKVKKKFTTSDLLARFSSRVTSEGAADAVVPAATSSAANSDATEPQSQETPPSSPPPAHSENAQKANSVVNAVDSTKSLTGVQSDDDDEPAAMKDILPGTIQKPQTITRADAQARRSTIESRLARLDNNPGPSLDIGSDDDLEVLQPLPHHLRALDLVRIPNKKKLDNSCKAIHTLRHLSHIGAYDAVPRRKGSRPAIGRNALEMQLRTKAKQQARQEQLDRIAELQAKGIVIQSAEEREKDAEVFENLLEKARQEALQLRQAEKAAQDGRNVDEGVLQPSDDESEDDDYLASGSENEEDEGAGLSEGECDEQLLDDAAEDDSNDESEQDDPESMGENMPDLLDEFLKPQTQDVDANASEQNTALHKDGSHPVTTKYIRRARITRIIVDDDDEDEDEGLGGNMGKTLPSLGSQPGAWTAATPSAKEDPFAIFDVGPDSGNGLLLSPTQAFNATMQTPTQATQSVFMDMHSRKTSSQFGTCQSDLDVVFGESPQADDEVDVVPNSQVPDSQRINLNWETQPPVTPKHPTMSRDISTLTETPGWEPTQDRGLPSPWTAELRRQTTDDLVEHETQSTVRLRISESPAPSINQKRGRLMRRRVTSEDADHAREPDAAASHPEKIVNAFDEMNRQRAANLSAAEREAALAEMKGMMDDQAEESDDEYAGVGGDDYIAPENEQDKAMIDSSHIDVDERALAAHFAERQRQKDEAETSKLYKDLTTGALRRKQANMFDLEDDEDDMAARRRQIKLQEEAKKRKLLLRDDNIAGLAEGKQSAKKDAFLKAIADDDDEADLTDFSEDGEAQAGPISQDDSTPASQTPQTSVLRETSGNKRPHGNDFDRAEDRPVAKLRRTQESNAFKRPTSLLEVKESLSFLLDEPDNALSGPSTLDVDSDEEQADAMDEDREDDMEELQGERDRQNDGGFAPEPRRFDAQVMPPPAARAPASQRRTGLAKTAVVDRLSLRRAQSACSDPSGTSAWMSPSVTAFKAPSLLKRATSNLSNVAMNDRGVSTPNLSRENSGVKMGGTKKSSLAYQARAEERLAIVEAGAKKRQENTAKMAQLRRSNTASALLARGLGGRFE